MNVFHFGRTPGDRVSDALFTDIAKADVVVVAKEHPEAAYVLGVAHGMGKAAVNDEAEIDRARPVWAAAPLTDILEPAAIGEPVRHYLQSQKIFVARDLGSLDLDGLAAAPGMTRHALTAFVRALAHSERFPDADKLRDFIIRRGIFV